ncbi:MAG TPA: acyl-CoA dehydrogenase family protein [Bdellovibrionales bacterium]|nr:acyl-CoA dehydrogenase family protein [Bdellovibrionales bacterium]
MIITPDHLQLRDSVRSFVEKEINPHIEKWEADERFPAHELFKKMGALGFLGIHKPEEYGGLGLDYSFNVVFAEEMGACLNGAIPMAVGVQTDMCTPALAKFGSKELCNEFLRPAISGEMVGCIGVSETDAGSDVAGLKTSAKSDGGDYVINGSKMWITNGAQADFMCLLANTSDGPAHKNKSLIIVPMKTKGISVSTPFEKIGMRASDTVQVFFDNVRIPKRNLIGKENEGFTMQMLQFVEERLYAAGSAIKKMELCIQKTIDYTRQRTAFGQSILDNQTVHFRLAELQTEIESLRALTYRSTALYVDGKQEEATTLASMAKLKAGRLLREVSDGCLQYWGGMGFMWENEVARSYRDGRVLSIGAGADEVMLGIIAKAMGTLPQKNKQVR